MRAEWSEGRGVRGVSGGEGEEGGEGGVMRGDRKRRGERSVGGRGRCEWSGEKGER